MEKKYLSLKTEIFLITISLFLMLLMMFGIYFTIKLKDIYFERAKETIESKNENLKVKTEYFFKNIFDIIQLLANRKEIIKGFYNNKYDRDVQNILKVIKKNNKYISYIYVGYKNNKILINDWVPPENFDLTRRPWYVQAKKNAYNLSMGLPYREIKTKEWLISQSIALKDQKNNFIGVLSIDCNISNLFKLFKTNVKYNTQRSYIIDNRGKILLHPSDKYINKVYLNIIKKIKGDSGFINYNLEGNRVVIGYYNKIKLTDWYLVTAVDKKEISKPIINNLIINFVIIVFLSIIVSMILNVIFLNRFAIPILQLKHRISDILEGKKVIEYPDKSINKEIAELINSIEEMTNNSFKKKNIELETIMEFSGRGFLVVNNSGKVMYSNSRFKKMFKIENNSIDNAEMITKFILDKIINKRIAIMKLNEIIKKNNEQSINVNDIIKLKDGRIIEVYYSKLIYNDEKIGNLFIFNDITRQRKMEEQLIKEKEKAKAASIAKSQFLANMSHEIRTPLNGIIGFTDLLLQTNMDKLQLTYLNNIKNSGESLLDIINDILDFSKIEAGKLELEFIMADIIELVESAIDIIKYNAAKKDLEVILNIDPDTPRFAVIDVVRLRQIIVNLLGNAIKFTEKGEVELKLKFKKIDQDTGIFNFNVRDTGIGIKKEHKDRLFKAFSQADNTITRKFGGTGLGLTISNKLLEKMGSTLEFDSEYGKGTNFYFSLKTRYKYGDKLSVRDINIKKVMIVDDNRKNGIILHQMLKNFGIDSTVLNNGKSAIKLIEQGYRPDLAIVDYNMPDMSGIQTIKEIRNILSEEELSIILLHSSIKSLELEKECKKLGVRLNLLKPIKSKELLEYLINLNSNNKKGFIHLKEKFIKILSKKEIKILIVEDVDTNMLLIETLIKSYIPNALLKKAINGVQAVEFARTNRFDLIFMDLHMPEKDGFQAAKEIREYEKKYHRNRTVIIALTAGNTKEEKEKAFLAGMDDYLTKPFKRDELENTLKKYIKEPVTEETNNLSKVQHNDYPDKIDGVDISEGIKRTLNRKELYFKFLFKFASEINQYLNEIEKAIVEDDEQAGELKSHALKGIAGNLSVEFVYKLAAELEQKFKNGNKDEYRKGFEELKKSVESFYKSVRQYIEK